MYSSPVYTSVFMLKSLIGFFSLNKAFIIIIIIIIIIITIIIIIIIISPLTLCRFTTQ